MAVVHHSSYVKYFEEARVAFLHYYGLEDTHFPNRDYTLAVLGLEVRYIKPLRVSDFFEVQVRAECEKAARIKFEYLLYLDGELMTKGSTLHVGVDKDLKVVKIPPKLKEKIETL